MGQIVFWVVAAGLAVAGYFFVRGIVTCWTITPIPGMTPADCGTITAGGTTYQAACAGTARWGGGQLDDPTTFENPGCATAQW